MKLSRFIPFAVVWAHSLAFNPFRAPSEKLVVDDRNGLTDVTFDFNPTELLDSKSRRPEFYTKAVIQLKRLEEEPLCHRMAAQLLINNCRGLEHIDEQNYAKQRLYLQRDHVEGFACSLAVCDMERARSPIPGACSQFTSSSLRRAARNANSKLELSTDEVRDCLHALTTTNHWSTWLSYRDNALLFCRAARMDIEKDSTILLHKQLAEILESFTKDLQADLEELNQKFADNRSAYESHFEEISKSVEDWTSKVRGSFKSVSVDVEAVKSSMKSVADTAGNAVHVMEKFISTFLQGHAEMADEQRNALAVTTDKFQTHVMNLANLVGESTEGALELKSAIQLLVPMVADLSTRQTALEDQSTAIFSNLVNATEILQAHVQKLAQADSAVSGIHENLDRAAEAVRTWTENFPVGGGMTDWACRIGTPVGALILGNYGITPTLSMNAVLLFSGLVGGETVVQLRRLGFPYSCCQIWWSQMVPENPSDIHLPQEQVESPLTITPVEFERTSKSSIIASSFRKANVDMAYTNMSINSEAYCGAKCRQLP